MGHGPAACRRGSERRGGNGGGLPLVVTDLDGALLTQVAGVADVSDVVLSDDRSTLFVAAGFARVAALDADTLAVTASYPAPDGACVYAVEPAGGKLVGAFVDYGIGSTCPQPPRRS